MMQSKYNDYNTNNIVNNDNFIQNHCSNVDMSGIQMVTQYARQCVTINNTMNNVYNTLQYTMTYNKQYNTIDTIYNNIQNTIQPI